ncbi:MAG: hypothetical protein HWD58_05140 [Bacteroidota bacterium]|nr:MAG: hypothetical protein HWD58_05140 [Bacteroidota bacterium]
MKSKYEDSAPTMPVLGAMECNADFSTAQACPTPQNLNVINATATSATSPGLRYQM